MEYLDEKSKNQITNCLQHITDIFPDNIKGIYLYGSALVGGLQKYSDIDLFVVLKRAISDSEKQKIIEGLLKISGIYMKSDYRPIEMTVVVYKDINPWNYPPKFDFQYGEWLREEFTQGVLEPYQSKEMPDLAVLITQLLLANRCLYGDGAEAVLPKVPYVDFMQAMTAEIEHLKKESLTDTRNVLLALARIWATVETDSIYTKPDAALWAIGKLPNELVPALAHARFICIGDETENWQDMKNILKSCIDYMCRQIEKIKQGIVGANQNKKITLAKIFDSNDVLFLIDKFKSHNITTWLDGGWGVDALLGKQTRNHADIDIIIQKKDVQAVVALLLHEGYNHIERDDSSSWNFVLGNKLGKEIDIHVIEFDANGNGIYGPAERNIFYPAASLSGAGLINGIEVRCLTPDYQILSHTGYDLKEKDLKDLAALCEKFNLEPPPEYKILIS